MSYASILKAAEQSAKSSVGEHLTDADQRIRDELIVAGDEAVQAYSLIKTSVMSNVKVDLQHGVSAQWDSMAQDIAGGAIQLGMGALKSLTGGSTKFMNEIGAAAASIFAGAVDAASSGNWGEFAMNTLTQLVNLIDDIIQEVLLRLIEVISDTMVEVLGDLAGSIPLVGAIIQAVIGVVQMFAALEDGRKKINQAVIDKVPELCEHFYKCDVVASGKSQVPADLFVQVAAGPCAPSSVYMGNVQTSEGSATMTQVYVVPNSSTSTKRATDWGPYCAPGLENVSTSVLNVGGPEAASYGLTYATLLDDMIKYQHDWYRFGRGRLTRVPQPGKVLMVATERNDALDYSRRNFYRSMRMAIQRTFWAGGDGGASLLPLYIDAIKADRRRGVLSDANLKKVMSENFQATINHPPNTVVCDSFVQWGAVEGVKQLVANWTRDTESAMYASDAEAIAATKVAVRDARASVKAQTKGKKLLTLAPSAYKRVMLKPKATRSGSSGGSVLPLGLLVGGIATMMFLARQQPRKRAYSY